MTRKPYPGSLFARLKTTENRYLVFSWIYEEGISYAEVATRIQEQFDITANEKTVCYLVKTRGFAWRFDDSVERAEEQKCLLPADYDQKRRNALAQREFEAMMQDLSFKEIMIAQRLELAREKVKLQQEMEPQKLALARRKVEAIESRLAATQKMNDDTALTPAEKQERIRELFGAK